MSVKKIFYILILTSLLCFFFHTRENISVHASDSTITVYTALLEREANIYIQAFENYTGIKVKLVRKSTGILLNLLRQDHNYRPGVDVLLGGPAEFYYLASQEGLFEQYISPEIDRIPAKYRDPDYYWYGIYLGFIGFAVNPIELDKHGLELPNTWSDLASSEYKNLITCPNPVSSGTGYTAFSTVIQIYGFKEGFKLLENINNNINEYTDVGAMASKLTSLGSSAVGISFSHDIQKLIQQGAPLKLVIPTDGTGYEIGGIAIVKGTQNLSASRMFLDFMLSDKVQKLYSAMGEFRVPTNIDTPIPDGAISFSDINDINYDLKWSSVNQQKIIDTWLNTIYRGGNENEGN